MGRLATQMEDSCSVLAAGQRVGEEAFLPQRVQKQFIRIVLYAYIHLTITIK